MRSNRIFLSRWFELANLFIMPPSISNEIPNPRYKVNHKSGAFCNRNKCLLASKSVENNQSTIPIKISFMYGKKRSRSQNFFSLAQHQIEIQDKYRPKKNNSRTAARAIQIGFEWNNMSRIQHFCKHLSGYICVIRTKHPLQTEKPFLVLLFFTWID